MSLLEVLKFPDPRLRHKGKVVEAVTPDMQQLADNMLETMYHSKGIGLAAIQVGVEVRLLVIDITPQNPEDLAEITTGTLWRLRNGSVRLFTRCTDFCHIDITWCIIVYGLRLCRCFITW